MKFAIGFVVGAFVGRPVLQLVSRRTGLTSKVEGVVIHAVYSLADSFAEEENRRSAEDKPKRDKTWGTR
jgi:hypothetical protein